MRCFKTLYFLCQHLRRTLLTEIGRFVENTVNIPVKFLVLIANVSFNSCVQYFGKMSNFLYQFRGHAVAQLIGSRLYLWDFSLT